MSKFLAIVRSGITTKRKDYLINPESLRRRNIFCFLFSFSFYEYFVDRGLSHFFRNFSYGVKPVASSSAFRRSRVSSRSSINSNRFLYLLKPITTEVFRPFSSIMYRGPNLFENPDILTSPFVFKVAHKTLKVKNIVSRVGWVECKRNPPITT